MAERMIQVPESLLRGMRDALAEHDDPHCEVGNQASDQACITHVDALLSAPAIEPTTTFSGLSARETRQSTH